MIRDALFASLCKKITSRLYFVPRGITLPIVSINYVIITKFFCYFYYYCKVIVNVSIFYIVFLLFFFIWTLGFYFSDCSSPKKIEYFIFFSNASSGRFRGPVGDSGWSSKESPKYCRKGSINSILYGRHFSGFYKKKLPRL